jgi:hypothetical protein
MKLQATAMAVVAILAVSHTADAASAYKKCIQKVQKTHKDISRVIPLEGVTKGLSLQKKTDKSVLSASQVAALQRAFDDILECREKAQRKASRYPDALAIMNNVFGKFDIVYIDLLQKDVAVGIASAALVNMRNEADVRIKKIEADISAEAAENARRNSADGWKLMQEGLDMMYPPDPPKPKPIPTYTCRTFSGRTHCTPDS